MRFAKRPHLIAEKNAAGAERTDLEVRERAVRKQKNDKSRAYESSSAY